jgi:inhibitor of KinA sporulation pathway (predicted exonuclease)
MVVLDLEATCWDARDPILATRQRAETEVVEIGAVRLRDGTPPASFQAFVRPARHPRLSAFCTELTGITQADVDAAAPFPSTWPAFLAFCGGDDGLVLASWGAFDDSLLRRECRRHRLPAPRWTHLNVKARFAARRERTSLGGALASLGLPFAGRAHRALDDARNVARALAWLRLP